MADMRLRVDLNPLLKDDLRAELNAEGLPRVIEAHRQSALPYLVYIGVGDPAADTYKSTLGSVLKAVARTEAKHPGESIAVIEEPDDSSRG